MSRLHLALAAAVLVGLCAAPPISAAAPSPVLILHGWHGAGADRLEGSPFAPLAARLAADGHPVYWAAGIAVDPAHSTAESARRLGAEVRRVAGAHPGQPVDIVAHSYGGVIARAYLETELYSADRAAGVRVGTLVALASPMTGVDFWTPLLFLLGDPFGEPSVWELTPGHMAEFNRSHRQPADVRYRLVAGDARPQSALLWLLPPSDGAIGVASAHGLAAIPGRLDRVRTDDVHTMNAWIALVGWHSYLDHAPTYRRAIAPALGAAPAAAAPAQRVASAPAGLVATSTFAHTPARLERLAAGERREVPVGAGAAGLLFGGEEGLDLTVTPIGRVEPERWGAGQLPEAAIGWPSAEPAGVARVGVEALPGQMAGTLAALGTEGGRITLGNGRAAARSVAWIGLLPAGAPGLRLEVRPSGPGLVASLSGRGARPTDARAELWTADGSRPFDLRDDGFAPDLRAGDGVFAGYLAAGDPRVFVRARATVRGQALEVEVTLERPQHADGAR